MRTRMLALTVGSIALAGCTSDLPTEGSLTSSDPRMILEPTPTTPAGCGSGSSATALDIAGLLLDATLSEAVLDQCTGQADNNLANSSYSGLYSAEALSADVYNYDGVSRAAASLADLNLTIGGYTIAADLVQSNAWASCTGQNGSSLIENLTINGELVNMHAYAGGTHRIALAGGRIQIWINEQIPGTNARTVNALRIDAPGMDIVASSAHAQVACSI